LRAATAPSAIVSLPAMLITDHVTAERRVADRPDG
jgi:hypothetical protein